MAPVQDGPIEFDKVKSCKGRACFRMLLKKSFYSGIEAGRYKIISVQQVDEVATRLLPRLNRG